MISKTINVFFDNVNIFQVAARLWLEPVFALTHPEYRDYKRSLKIVHDFTDKIIKTRRQTMNDEQDEYTEKKKRLAFLDLIIDASDNGALLTDEDIKDEVNGIMFAGHDTTSTNVMYTLYALAANPECQKRVHEELDEIFGEDVGRHVTNDDMTKMQYLSSCLKESMRLYTTVPVFSRTTVEDLVVEVSLA